MAITRKDFIKSLFGTAVIAAVPTTSAITHSDNLPMLGCTNGKKNWHCIRMLDFNDENKDAIVERFDFETKQEVMQFAQSQDLNSFEHLNMSMPPDEYKFYVFVYYVDMTNKGNCKFYVIKEEAMYNF